MKKRRYELQMELEEISGLPVYFQPPENLKMQYPCIVYEKDSSKLIDADNKKYLRFPRYSLTLIHKDPDNELPDLLLDHFQYISEGNRYIADNLYHDTFTLYY